MTTRVTVAMPVYNEAAGITEFISEIINEFAENEITIVVVDDCSNDKTFQILELFQTEVKTKIIYCRNSANMGHGPSTLRAIAESLKLDSDIVITVDGDGQFYGSDIYRVYQILKENIEIDVVETIRVNRKDPVFRRVISWATRILVQLKSRQTTKDANSPLRAYRRTILESFTLDLIEQECLVPNIWISTIIRRKKIRKKSIEVEFIPRRGGDQKSITWRQKYDFIPSIRFIKFSLKALAETIKL